MRVGKLQLGRAEMTLLVSNVSSKVSVFSE